MKSRARVGATLVALAATAAAALLLTSPAQAAPGATGAPTRTTLSGADIAFGATAHLKAVVKPVVGTGKPTGTVTFSEGATVLSTVSLALANNVETAKLDVPGLAMGDHTFTATYNGSASFAASTSLPFLVNVGPAASVTTLSFSGKYGLGEKLTMKGTVKAKVSGTGTPAGSVTFTDGGTTVGTAPLALSGGVYQAKLLTQTLTVGDHSIVATFVPSGGSLAGSSSSAKMVTITKIVTTIVLNATKLSTDGSTLTLTAKVSPGGSTGIVTFTIDALPGQQVAITGSFGLASLSVDTGALASGTHTLQLSYGGDATHAASSTTTSFTL
jgi:hypothetical protein